MKKVTEMLFFCTCMTFCACSSERGNEVIEPQLSNPFETEQPKCVYTPTATWISTNIWEGAAETIEFVNNPDQLKKYLADEVMPEIDWSSVSVAAGYLTLPDMGYEIVKQELREYQGGYVQVVTIKKSENAYMAISGHTFYAVYPKLGEKQIWLSIHNMEDEQKNE